MAATLGIATLETKVDLSGLDRGLSDAESKSNSAFSNIGSGITSMGAVALGIGAAGVAAVGAAAVLAARDFIGFDQQMREVFTLMPDITGEAMGDMTDQVKDFSREFGVLPEEVVPALYQAISAGLPPENVFEFLETAQKAAAGGVTDLTTAVDGISSVVNAYGDEVISAEQASDAMFTAVRLGKTNFEELSASLFQVIPTASALGVEFGDVTAGLAAMTAQGTPTNVATTQMRQLFVELSKAGGDASGVFEDMAGVTFQEFIAQGGNVADALGIMEQAALDNGVQIQDLFGSVEAGNAALALTGSGAETFAANLEEMANAAGATDAAFETMDASLGATIDRIKATGKVALLDFGEALAPLLGLAGDFAENILPRLSDVLENRIMPVVTSVVEVVRRFFVQLSNGIDPITGIVGAIGGLMTVFGGTHAQAQAVGFAIWDVVNVLKAVLGPVVEAIGKFVEWKDVLIALGVVLGVGIAIIVGPLVLAIVKISLLIAGVIAVVSILRNAWESDWLGIRTALVSAWEGHIQPAIAQLREWLGVNIPIAMERVKEFWEVTLRPALMAARDYIIGTVVPAIATAYEWLKTNIPLAFQAVREFWQNTLLPALTAARNFILNDVVPAITEAYEWLSIKLTGAFTTVKTFWENTLKPALEAIWSFVKDDIVPTIQSAVDVVMKLAEIAFTAIQGAWQNILQPVLQDLWEWIKDKISPTVTEAHGFMLAISNFISVTFGPIVQGLVNGALGALRGVLDGISGALQGVRNWLDNVKAALDTFTLPAVLTPGSPSPFEVSLRGIADALGVVNKGMEDFAKNADKVSGVRIGTPKGISNYTQSGVVGDIYKDPDLVAAELAMASSLPMLGPPPTSRGDGNVNNWNLTINQASEVVAGNAAGSFRLMQAYYGGA